jgi:hypothetical protein
MIYDSHFPLLDGLFAATRTAELLNEETQAGWQDKRGRDVSQMFLKELLKMHDALPDQLISLLKSIAESDLAAQKSRDIHHLYRQSEATHSHHLAESREERHRAFSCADLSRTRCHASEGSVQRAISLINHANSTTLHF